MRISTLFFATFLFMPWMIFGISNYVVSSDGQISIAVDLLADDYQNVLQQALSESIIIDDFTITADANIPQKELIYLCGMHSGQEVNADILTRAIFYLTKKEKFESAVIKCSPNSTGNYDLDIHLSCRWTVKKVQCTGIMLGKDLYRSYYLMEPGEPFDLQKHQQSVDRIKERLYAQGYCDAHIEDSIIYDQKQKSVNITLALSCGSRFIIRQLQLALQTDDLPGDEYQSLKEKIDEKFSKRLKNKLYTRELLAKETASLKKFLSRKGFLRAQIYLNEVMDNAAHSVQLEFVIDVQKKKEFVFFGNHFFSNEQLFECIVQFGRAAASLPPMLLAQEIEQLYQVHGYWHASVECKEDENRIFFMINEGVRAKIAEIDLQGIFVYDPDDLVKSHFLDVVSARQFEPAVLQKAIRELLARYANDGYFDAQIIEQKMIVVPNKKNQQRLRLSIEEGEPTKITKIIVKKFPEIVGQIPWCEEYSIDDAPICTQVLLNEQKKWLESMLLKYNYHQATIKSDVQQDGNAVTIIWKIDRSKSEQYFGKTIFVGNDTLDYSIISRELCYAENNHFDADCLRDSLHKIRGLNIFDRVTLQPEQSDFLGNERPVIVRVVNRDTFEIRVRGGIGLQQMSKPIELVGLTYIIGGSFIINNATNAADQFCLNLHATKTYRDILFKYDRPWLLNFPWRLLVQGYSTKYQQPGYFDYKEGLYTVRQHGLITGIRRCHGGIDGAVTANFEWLRTNIRPEYACVESQVVNALAVDPRLIDRNVLYVGLEPTLILDYTDQKLDPHRGLFTLFSMKGMLPLQLIAGLQPSLKCLFEQSFFVPLRSWVAALRVRLGYMFGPPLPEINLIERFYLGGPHSLRSYAIDCTPPLGVFYDHLQQYCVPQGAKAMVNVNAELRIPIFGSVGAVLFQDLGWLSDNKQSVVHGGRLLAGTGFGIRYLTPIGPLRFDIGWKWTRHDGCFQHRYSWYLSLGQMF